MSKLVKRRQIEGAISNFEYIEMRTKQIAKLNELDSHYAPSIFNSSELLDLLKNCRYWPAVRAALVSEMEKQLKVHKEHLRESGFDPESWRL